MAIPEDLDLITAATKLLERLSTEVTSIITSPTLEITFRSARGKITPGERALNYALQLTAPLAALGWRFKTYTATQDHVHVTLTHPGSQS